MTCIVMACHTTQSLVPQIIVSWNNSIILIEVITYWQMINNDICFIFTANWLEARTIKYANFPAKYMNSRSKLHWNIHVVLCQVGITWNNRWGIGIPELCNHAERHSTFNSSPKWILLIIYFYDIFLVFSPLLWCQQVYWHQTLPPNWP